jgi:hypothetical protein
MTIYAVATFHHDFCDCHYWFNSTDSTTGTAGTDNLELEKLCEDTDCPTLLEKLDCDYDDHVTIDELNDKFIDAWTTMDWSFLDDEEEETPFDIDAFMIMFDENESTGLDEGEFTTCYYAFCNDVCPNTNPDNDDEVYDDDENPLIIGLAQV